MLYLVQNFALLYPALPCFALLYLYFTLPYLLYLLLYPYPNYLILLLSFFTVPIYRRLLSLPLDFLTLRKALTSSVLPPEVAVSLKPLQLAPEVRLHLESKGG